MKPYIPICQDVSDSVSALMAAQIAGPGARSRIGLMEKYWNTMPNA